MPAFTCPHCQKPFNVPAAAAAAQGRCPHCRQAVGLPKTKASRWFCAKAKKKHGPYTWQQLRALAERGDLGADDMLLQEGAKQWVRAGSLPALFASVAPAAQSAPAKRPARRSFPWLSASLAGIGVLAIIGLAAAGYFYFTREKPTESNAELLVENKKGADDRPPKKGSDPPKKEAAKEKKKLPEGKKPKTVSTEEWTARFVERLNRNRKSAGLGSVTLDAELSRGCAAQAKQVDPDKADASLLSAEVAGPTDALDRFMGRLASRAALLTPELQSVGLAFAPNGKGGWICVLDAVRGRGEPIVVYPAAKQTGVPLSFTSGREVPDAKAAAGYPITLMFPPARKVTGAKIELRDERGKLVAGWLWTPEKLVPGGRQHNTIALIPKGLLHSGAVYQVKAGARVDGKPWDLAWSFTTEDEGDGAGVWAKKALARVNGCRSHAGLKPVALDDALSRDCLKHARYLVLNEGQPALDGLKAHGEDQALPGFSAAGDAAGKASVIGFGDYEPIDSVDSWMATLYHRVPILQPNLKTIGFACARGRRQGWVTVMNVSSGRAKGPSPQPVFYPAADQTGVPLSFPNGGEEPNPIPVATMVRAGFPITATFPHGEPLVNATAALTDAKGVEVPCWFSSPEKLANRQQRGRQGNTVCLIPKSPLAIKRTYRVHLQGQSQGKPWKKNWTFTTGEGGPSVPAASRAVVERLNRFRAQAGLSAIALDEKLSPGCQQHAEYLARNADRIAQTGASVNDEDASLPGFTRDGLQAAQSTDVFRRAYTPVIQIDDLMATFTRRVYLLNPNLQRIGFGCSHDVGRGWCCVLDVQRGKRIVVYPAPKQDDVPTTGFDALQGAKGRPGFPISVVFPPQAVLRNAQAVLQDAAGKDVRFHLSTPEKPLDAKLPNIVSVHPLEPLQAGRTYSVTISVIVSGTEWRESWQFTTAK